MVFPLFNAQRFSCCFSRRHFPQWYCSIFSFFSWSRYGLLFIVFTLCVPLRMLAWRGEGKVSLRTADVVQKGAIIQQWFTALVLFVASRARLKHSEKFWRFSWTFFFFSWTILLNVFSWTFFLELVFALVFFYLSFFIKSGASDVDGTDDVHLRHSAETCWVNSLRVVAVVAAASCICLEHLVF